MLALTSISTSDADCPTSCKALPALTNVPTSASDGSSFPNHKASLESNDVSALNVNIPANQRVLLASTNVPASDAGNSVIRDISLEPASEVPNSGADNPSHHESPLASTNTATSVAMDTADTTSPSTAMLTDSNDSSGRSTQTLSLSQENGPGSNLLTELKKMVVSFNGAALSMF